MMDQGLHSKTYLSQPKTGRDFASALISIIGLGAVAWAITQASSLQQLFDVRSVIIVGLGTLATTLLQYDFRSLALTLSRVVRSFVSGHDPKAVRLLHEVDDAIMKNEHLATLRDGERVDGELLNDVVYMYNQGLLFDEINQFVTARVEDEFTKRRTAADVLRRAALTAPALGLFGTVIGLMG
ncbi:MAG: MotA/TolQ/ExbB proton channel family protein, partial [Myxococcota bacterium]